MVSAPPAMINAPEPPPPNAPLKTPDAFNSVRVWPFNVTPPEPDKDWMDDEDVSASAPTTFTPDEAAMADALPRTRVPPLMVVKPV